jgi:putative ABC transport system permease protein
MQSKQNLMLSYDSFMQILNTSVMILIVGAIILGVIVLYNLGVMSYVERYRELATLKVVGFKDKSIGKILISQNIWLTIIGILIGLPAGVGVLKLLIVYMASEYELKLSVGLLTYVFAFLFTLGISLVVSFFIARKNKKINMVEALKCAE